MKYKKLGLDFFRGLKYVKVFFFGSIDLDVISEDLVTGFGCYFLSKFVSFDRNYTVNCMKTVY